MFKYVPVLRFRDQERTALKTVKLSDKTLPLVEIIASKSRENTNKSFTECYEPELKEIGRPLMIDIPTYITGAASGKARIKDFLTATQRDFSLRVKYLKELKGIPDLIPVVTYAPSIHYTQRTKENTPIRTQVQALRAEFPKLAFRLFPTGLSTALNEVKHVAAGGDIIMLDIDRGSHDNVNYKKNSYPALQKVASDAHCQTVLIRAAINDELMNSELPHDEPIDNFDNSLLQEYTGLGFGAFGDYAGLKNDRITRGGKGTPGFVFYHWDSNQYIGFRGNDKDMNHYYTVILPSVLNSRFFNDYSAKHKQECPACRILIELGKHAELFKSHAKWKGLAVMHYLHTLEQFL